MKIVNDPEEVKSALPGDCFHGEVWLRCPYCLRGTQIVGKPPADIKGRWIFYECDVCGKIFKEEM